MWSHVEAVSEQDAGLVSEAQTQLAVLWLEQQSPGCPECVQTRFGQRIPARTRERIRQRTQVKVCEGKELHNAHSELEAGLPACTFLTHSALCRLRGRCSTVGYSLSAAASSP